jgi:MarR family transcriptional regulator, organic hydroperoxide resistance regulator
VTNEDHTAVRACSEDQAGCNERPVPTDAELIRRAGPEISLQLDDQLCFALYAAQRAVTAAYRPVLEELGLTYPQYLVLLVLWERGETTVKELAAALRLDYGTVSPLLKRLESAGFVRRERAAHDERTVLVACTGRGEELREHAAGVPGALVSVTGLQGPEITRLREELWRLATRAQEAAVRPL